MAPDPRCCRSVSHWCQRSLCAARCAVLACCTARSIARYACSIASGDAALPDRRVCVLVSFANETHQVGQMLGCARQLAHGKGIRQAFAVLARSILVPVLGSGTCPLLPFQAWSPREAGVKMVGRSLDDLPHVVDILGGLGSCPLTAIKLTGRAVGCIHIAGGLNYWLRVSFRGDPLHVLRLCTCGDVSCLECVGGYPCAPVMVRTDDAVPQGAGGDEPIDASGGCWRGKCPQRSCRSSHTHQARYRCGLGVLPC